MANRAQLFSDPRMTSNHAALLITLALLAASQDASAVSSENCAMFEQSIAQGKAVASDSTVFVAVSSKDPDILQTKYPIKTAQRRLQTRFLKYCGDFSGYKAFQVEARGGTSGSVVCNGKTNYAFAIKKSEITIKELTGADASQTVDMPDFDGKGDPFEEFK